MGSAGCGPPARTCARLSGLHTSAFSSAVQLMICSRSEMPSPCAVPSVAGGAQGHPVRAHAHKRARTHTHTHS